MKVKNKTLMASALVFSCLATLAVGGQTYALDSITTMEDLTTCLTTNNSVCTLGGDIAVNGTIDIPQNTKTSLDLNGYRLYENENQLLYIYNHGDLTILNSGTTIGSCDARIEIKDSGQLEISNGTFNDAVVASSDSYVGNTSIKISGGVFNNIVYAHDNNSLLDISGGTFNYSVSFEGKTANISDGTFNDGIGITNGTVGISNGTFNNYVSFGGAVSATISGGTFFKNVYNSIGASMVINSGTFNDSVSSNGDDEINGGTFKGTLFVGNTDSSLVINGGTFNDINAISYDERSSLTITDGKFMKGFSIGLEKLSITGGTFYNGATNSDGWMALILEYPDVQEYSITGGTFLNTGDDYGVLMAIKTVTPPTLDSIKSLFAGGTVLSGTVIDLSEEKEGSSYWSYIRKQKTDADGVDVKVPDTGMFGGENQNGIVAMISVGLIALASGIAYISGYIVKRYRGRVGFKK